ncbi:hypothetical protein [Sulfuricurvum sp.]|uniref:hypothetical protein n=1 Tax=Sulfuricurvum sp. TaxID=2025608 RepID=UPI00263498E2|nr:hypothetical protein [Sulfuricurvum sp.]MDD2780369.1 hypothetical protein [Sulfuricurvum sp.]
MKKVALSALAAAMISGVASADALTLYSDPKTGQVYTTPGEGRVEMGDFVDAKTVDMADREIESSFSEYKDAAKKYTNVKSKAKTLEFSGTHYLGFTTADPETKSSTKGRSSGFEMRRNYVQVKAFFNDKDYARVTMDTTKELSSDTGTLPEGGDLKTSQGGGYADVFIKYAYLYLDNVLPYTGVEAGIVHRPWIDYEEHNAWHYRSFNKVALEEKSTPTESGVDLINSADFGVNFKTKTENFSSEIGVFNGEGYHADKKAGNQQNDSKLSVEWRLTGHLIGSGKKIGKNDRTKDSYLNISTMGIVSHNHKDDNIAIGDAAEYDRTFYGIHAVYNQPEFLLAAQYVKADDDVRIASGTDSEYDLFSINAEIRPFTDWTIIGRYDDYKKENKTAAGVTTLSYEGTKKIAALAYKYNKNVSFIGTAKYIDEENAAGTDTGASKDVYMLTTELKW